MSHNSQRRELYSPHSTGLLRQARQSAPSPPVGQPGLQEIGRGRPEGSGTDGRLPRVHHHLDAGTHRRKASAAAIGTAYASEDISSRRRFLRLGGAGALSLGGLLQARLHAGAAGAAAAAKIKACIFVFYYGGPSHLDTYDLKPDAPSAVRGEFQPIATTIPGLQVCEHLPHMSKVMHHCALLRGMHHRNRLHDSASIETHTGRQAAQGDREEFAPIAQFFPCHGATLSALWRDRGLVVPHAALPFVFHNVVDVPCQGGGFLGSSVDPFRIAVDPEKRSYVAAELSPRDNLTSGRMQSRLELLSGLQRSSKMTPGMAAGLEAFYGKAFQLLSASSVREALDLEQEPLKVRERYGIYTAGRQVDDHTTVAGPGEGYGSHMRGQNLLLARRLVEAGIPFVNVYDYKQQGKNWDSHGQNFELHKRDLLPPADKALSALITDLSERGLLDSTLIVATGEFGRTPTINANAGRDHWPDCCTVLLAGGGIQGGRYMALVTRLAPTPRKIPSHQLTWPRQFTGDSVSSRLHTLTIERLARGSSCPNCYSHDDPNLDPERKPGPGPRAWWNNSSCRNPGFHLPNFGPSDGATLDRIQDRAALRRQLDELRRTYDQREQAGAFARWDAHRRQALRFVLSTLPGTQNPFDLTRESDRTRDLYGREEWGQGFLTARRLIEAGVRMVQVNLRGWDTHQNAFRDLKGKLLPSLDHCLSGFLDDLSDRGLLDETLIVMCGEMGRTPRISPIAAGGKNASGVEFTPGRHHWGDVFPCFFAGGGVQPGRIIGRTDEQGGLPATEAHTPEDLAATIFHCLGVGPDREFHDASGRPYRITRGQPIHALL